MREKGHFVTTILTASILAGSMLSQAFAAPMDYTVSVDDENHFIFYDFDEVQVRIPDEWEDSLLVLPEEEKVGFYHKASHESASDAGAAGLLFELQVTANGETPADDENNTFSVTGEGNEGAYAVRYPRYEQGYMDDPEIWDEWCEMKVLSPWVKIKMQSDSEEKTQTGVNTTPLDDMEALYSTMDTIQGTLLAKDTEGDETKVTLQTEDGQEFSFVSDSTLTWDISGECGDYVRVTYLCDLYGMPIIRNMAPCSSRESYAEGIKRVRGTFSENSDDYLYLDAEDGSFFELINRRAPKPEEYTEGQKLEIEYLGEDYDAYMVRVSEVE